MRKEIEVKAKVENLKEIEEKLIALGCTISTPITQHDTIFVDKSYGPFDGFQLKKNVLRIRKSGGIYIFTIKQPQENELDNIEYETEIKNPEEFQKALLLMGYQRVVEVRKIRRKTNYNDWEICLDEVDGLGSFVEVEKLGEDNEAEAIQRELFEFLKRLGVEDSDRVARGYDTLMYIQSKGKDQDY